MPFPAAPESAGERRIRPGPPAAGLAAVCAILAACMQGDGLVPPSDPGGLPLLARFQGKAWNEGDTTLSAKRFLRLTDPKLVLVWQSVIPQSYAVAFEKSAVKVNAPYQFDVELRNPPPLEVQESEEPVIGFFWLYSDGDGDDKLGRLAHPEVQAWVRILDSLKAREQAAIRAFRESAESLPREIPIRDTFLVESSGTFIRITDGDADTLYAAKGNGDERVWFDVTHRRYQILRDLNAWDRFFTLRKKTSNFFRDTVPVPGHAYRMAYHDRQKLFPRDGREGEFRSLLRQATLASVEYYAALYALLGESAARGWADYPYSGFLEEGQDWVAGRSRVHFLLYFPDRRRLETILEAERAGSFRVEGIDRMRVGYNLLNCDQDYRCKVLSFSDSIRIFLGETNAYFDPPSLPPARPVTRFSPVSVSAGASDGIQGTYDYLPFQPIVVLSREGASWAHIPGFGLHRLHPADSLAYFVSGEDLQAEFVPTTGGAIGKMMFYSGATRSVGARMELPADTADLARRVRAIRDRAATALADTVRALLPRFLEYGRDTVEILVSGSGDSLRLRHPRLPLETYLPFGDSEAYSPDSEKRLRFGSDRAGRIPGMFLDREGGAYFLPAIGHVPRIGDPVGDAAYSPFASHPGSGRDSYSGLGGKSRYACPDSNGLFLRQGDGMVASLRKADQADSITLQNGGDALRLRVEGLAGKVAKLELGLCAERGQKSGRLMVSVKGGGAPDRLEDEIAESHWIAVNEKGGTLSVAGIPIPSSPYYIEIIQTSTLDRPFRYAFGSYTLRQAE